MNNETQKKSQKERSRRFFDWLAVHYDSGLLNLWLIGILKRILNQINIKRNSRILDAGCGTGNLFNLLANRTDLQFYGIDISPRMLELAKKKLDKKVRLRLQSVEEIKYKNKFDYIFSTEAFHHYSDQHQAMKNFYLSLKKKGKLVVADLNFWIFNRSFHFIEPGNSKMNSSNEFKRMFEENKFKDVKQKRIGLFAVLTIGEK